MFDYIRSFFFGSDAYWHIRELDGYDLFRFGLYKRTFLGVKSITGLSYSEAFAKRKEKTKPKTKLPGLRIR